MREERGIPVEGADIAQGCSARIDCAQEHDGDVPSNIREFHILMWDNKNGRFRRIISGTNGRFIVLATCWIITCMLRHGLSRQLGYNIRGVACYRLESTARPRASCVCTFKRSINSSFSRPHCTAAVQQGW